MTCRNSKGRGLRHAAAIATAVGFLGAAVGVEAAVSPTQVVEALEKSLRKFIVNPSASGAVTIKILPQSTAATTKGRFKEVEIRSEPAKIKGKIPLEEINLTARDVVVEVDRLLKEGDIATTSVGDTTLRAVFSEEGLTSMLSRGKSTRDMNMKVKFLDSKVHVTGNWKLWVFKGPFETTGALWAQNKRYLNIKLETLKINRREAIPAMKTKFEETVNPLVDFEDLPFKPKVKSLRFQDNLCIVSG